MGKLFRPSPMASNPTQQQSSQPVQNELDPVNYAQSMLTRSGGDARAAFYLACKEKGVDANAFLKQVEMIQNPVAYAKEMMASDPRVKSLMTLASMCK